MKKHYRGTSLLKAIKKLNGVHFFLDKSLLVGFFITSNYTCLFSGSLGLLIYPQI